MSIIGNEKHFTSHGSCVVDMDSFHGFCGPLLGVKWGLRWGCSALLARSAVLDSLFHISVNLWPPDQTSSKSLHSTRPWVAPV